MYIVLNLAYFALENRMNLPRLTEKCPICQNILTLNASAEGASAIFKDIQNNVFLHCVDFHRIDIRTSGRTVSRTRQGFTLTEIGCRTRATNSKKLFARPKRKSPSISITKVMHQSSYGLIRIYLSSNVLTKAADGIQLITVS